MLQRDQSRSGVDVVYAHVHGLKDGYQGWSLMMVHGQTISDVAEVWSSAQTPFVML